jgi:hypothetical protein
VSDTSGKSRKRIDLIELGVHAELFAAELATTELGLRDEEHGGVVELLAAPSAWDAWGHPQ